MQHTEMIVPTQMGIISRTVLTAMAFMVVGLFMM